MKERLIGVLIGVAAVAALAAAWGFASPTQGHDSPVARFRLFDHPSSYNNDGKTLGSTLYLLDTEDGTVYRVSPNSVDQVPRKGLN